MDLRAPGINVRNQLRPTIRTRRLDALGAAFSITPTGLVAGVAEIGSEAGIGYTIDPDNGTETVKWSNSSNPADAATYGTGAAPTSLAAGNGGTLYLHVTDGGETVTRSYPIRYPAPVAAGALGDESFTVGTGIQTSDPSGDITFGGTLVWSVRTGPAGVDIPDGTLPVEYDTDTLSEQADTAIVLRATDAVDATRFDETGYSLDITAAPVAPVISIDSITVQPGDDLVSLSTDTINDGDWVWGIVLNGDPALDKDGAGGWIGTPVNSGTFPVGLDGAQSPIPEDGDTGVLYDLYIYQRTGDGVDSNVDSITYTADNPQLNNDFSGLADDDLITLQSQLPSGATFVEEGADGAECFVFSGGLQASPANRTAYARRTDFSPQSFRRTVKFGMRTNVGNRKNATVTFGHTDNLNHFRAMYNAGAAQFQLRSYVNSTSSTTLLFLADAFPNGEERTMVIEQVRTEPGGTPTNTITVTVDGVSLTDDGTPTGNDTIVTTDLTSGNNGYRNFAGADPVDLLEGWTVIEDQLEDIS